MDRKEMQYIFLKYCFGTFLCIEFRQFSVISFVEVPHWENKMVLKFSSVYKTHHIRVIFTASKKPKNL